MIKRLLYSVFIVAGVFVITGAYWFWALLKFLTFDHHAFAKMMEDFHPREVWDEGIIGGLRHAWRAK